jgi:hypothetical protein
VFTPLRREMVSRLKDREFNLIIQIFLQ